VGLHGALTVEIRSADFAGEIPLVQMSFVHVFLKEKFSRELPIADFADWSGLLPAASLWRFSQRTHFIPIFLHGSIAFLRGMSRAA